MSKRMDIEYNLDWFTVPSNPDELPQPPEIQELEMAGLPVTKEFLEDNYTKMIITRSTRKTHGLAFYKDLLDIYVTQGQSPEFIVDNDPLYNYLYETLSDPALKILALRDETTARIFYDQMAAFIRDTVERQNYNLNRSMSEQEAIGEVAKWSDKKKRDGWQALWEKLDAEYSEFGFCSGFYKTEFLSATNLADPKKWRRMLDDWQEALNEKQRRRTEADIAYNGEKALNLIKKNLQNIPEYLSKNKVETEEFNQCWGVMGGVWNSWEFQRARSIVALQKEYPEIITAANAMGRIADEDGSEKIKVSQGDTMPLQHSAHSDIDGVIVGNDLNSLMPSELASCIDEDMNSLFVFKYLTRNLQSFRSRSNMLNPSRSLNLRNAKQKGPMLVCLDTSGSMTGQKEQIAHSMLIKLLDIADKQKRILLLITFSVSAKVIDVKKERAKLLDFMREVATGDTDASQMLSKSCDYLESNPEYMNADLILISDFQIPMVSSDLQARILRLKDEGTRLYGMQIGRGDNFEWPYFFDNIWHIMFKLHRRY